MDTGNTPKPQTGIGPTVASIIVVVILLGIAGYFVANRESLFEKPEQTIMSFEECKAAGYPIMESYPEQCKTPDGRTFVRSIPSSREAAWGSPFALKINEQAKFSDGLSLALLEINDSRCPAEVVCIWAGELSVLFRVIGGAVGEQSKDIRLGTVTAKNLTLTEYTFTLQDATESSATVSVTKRKKPAPIPAPTPLPTPKGEEITKKLGEQEGSFLIQRIGEGSVEGLWYQAYPVAQGEGTPKTLRIGDDIGYACEGVSEKLIRIDVSGQTVTFRKVTGKTPMGGCPICLAGSTLIDTPLGEVAVKDMRVGMALWTVDNAGNRVSGVVLKTSKVPVSPSHRMVHLTLADGRELFVSPGHPTSDRRTAGDLLAGERYDGAVITGVDRVSYGEGATYDVLPSGETGFYFANGILMDSTLRVR